MKEINRSRARVITLGGCAVCAQALFIREILGLVTGSELILGLILASYLFWIGAGGFIGARIFRKRLSSMERALVGLSISAAFSVPLIVILIRFGRSLLVDPPGSMPDLLQASAFIFLVISPFALIYGSIYNSASVAMRSGTGGIRAGISSTYVLETAGSIAGGLLLHLLLLSFLTQLEGSFVVTAIVIFVFLVTSRRGERFGLSAAMLAVAAGITAAPLLDTLTMSAVFRGYDVEEVVPSRYSELCVARIGETVSIFSGGSRLLTYPDREESGERVHLPLLAHRFPSSVLLIGGGLGGGVEEALSHPGVESVDWIELDERLPRLFWRYVKKSEGLKRSRLLTGDGRFLLKGIGSYDVIIINVPEPLNLRWNRYYTREFFELARKKLLSGGVLTVRHGSSENFISKRNASVLGILRHSLEAVFDNVEVLPGQSVIFVASDSSIIAGDMVGRLVERDLEGRLLALDELPSRISRERINYIESSLEDSPKRINTDSHPVILPYELILNGWRSGRAVLKPMEELLKLPSWLLPLVIFIAVVSAAISVGRSSAAKAAVFMTGMCSMTVQLSVMTAFQSFSGVLYQTIVLLTSLFMAGASVGAHLSGMMKGDGARRLFFCHMLMAAAALLVPGWHILLFRFGGAYSAGTAGFMALSAAGGILTGVYYRTAVETAWQEDSGVPPALFYSWDLFGACAGGMITGTLLLPLSGLGMTAITAVSIHCAAAIIITRKIRAG
jgi:spermidine synthase